MRKPVLTIYSQLNAWNTTIGGIKILFGTFVRYWQKAEYADKLIKLLALFKLKDDRARNLIPATVKCTSACFKCNLASALVHFRQLKGSRLFPRQGLFNRLKSTLLTTKWQREKTLFIHNFLQRQITVKGSKNYILWRYFLAAYSYSLSPARVHNF
ncbi:group 1 glycosyl transferase [Calothrix sp. PCC 6303]|uniref:group 1 glycosyl transferase n=1 Tax=Calothrix sp. PCC 6303 TaxID=1170562 RepID=UPI0002A04913|nr:group 1 glycosyl transferase [Calothrix sp. PCC 6303]AFZ00457.1 glycosyl transferase, group 1 [Calothrix sp. PCC 6303]